MRKKNIDEKERTEKICDCIAEQGKKGNTWRRNKDEGSTSEKRKGWKKSDFNYCSEEIFRKWEGKKGLIRGGSAKWKWKKEEKKSKKRWKKNRNEKKGKGNEVIRERGEMGMELKNKEQGDTRARRGNGSVR